MADTASPSPSQQADRSATQAPAAAVEGAVPAAAPPGRPRAVQAVLERLFTLYPRLFGAEFLPLKLGVFQELLARHPEDFQRDALKAALGVHTRSTRYLQAVAAGRKRHDLDGAPVDDVAPEHVHLALVELFRRRQPRTREDLRPKLRRQLVTAFEASGLERQDYLARVLGQDAEINTLVEEALAQHGLQAARQEALLRTYQGSGKTPEEFCDMYGVDRRDLDAALARARKSAAGS